MRESNSQPPVLETGALPIELMACGNAAKYTVLAVCCLRCFVIYFYLPEVVRGFHLQTEQLLVGIVFGLLRDMYPVSVIRA